MMRSDGMDPVEDGGGGVDPKVLVDHLDRVFRGGAWHGPALLTALRSWSAEEAGVRSRPDRPSPWELALHCAYWKHRVLQRITGGRKRFPRKGRDFPHLPDDRSANRWEADLALLEEVHRSLIEAVESLSSDQLHRPGPGQSRSRLEHVMGIGFHDAYHAGQIRLLDKLAHG